MKNFKNCNGEYHAISIFDDMFDYFFYQLDPNNSESYHEYLGKLSLIVTIHDRYKPYGLIDEKKSKIINRFIKMLAKEGYKYEKKEIEV